MPMRCRQVVVATTILSATLWACTERDATSLRLPAIQGSISDAVHESDNAHFFFLPPLVPAPTPTTAADPTVAPYLTVVVCEWSGGCVDPAVAVFTGGSEDAGSDVVRLDALDTTYVVDWHTRDATLDPDKTYRIRVLAAGTELGYLDVAVVQNAWELPSVPDGLVGVLAGRTVPIKFRIERGAVAVIGPAGGSASLADGLVRLSIPEGALTQTAGITARVVALQDAAEGVVGGVAWDMEPDGLRFAEPVELTLPYDGAAVPDDIVEVATSLVLASQQSGLWYETASTVDPGAHTVRGAIFEFSLKSVVLKTVSLDVSPASLTLAPTKTGQLVVASLDARGLPLARRAIGYQSADPGVATVDDGGQVIATGPGTTQLLVWTIPHVPSTTNPCLLPFAICTWPRHGIPLTVEPPVAAVEVSPPTVTLAVGQSVKLTVTLRDEQGDPLVGRDVAWTTSDIAVASVDADGLVSGIGPGAVDISATSGTQTGQAHVTVEGGDSDGDGVSNDADACPWDPGPWSNGGCPVPKRLRILPDSVEVRVDRATTVRAVGYADDGTEIPVNGATLRWTRAAVSAKDCLECQQVLKISAVHGEAIEVTGWISGRGLVIVTDGVYTDSALVKVADVVFEGTISVRRATSQSTEFFRCAGYRWVLNANPATNNGWSRGDALQPDPSACDSGPLLAPARVGTAPTTTAGEYTFAVSVNDFESCGGRLLLPPDGIHAVCRMPEPGVSVTYTIDLLRSQ